MKKYILACLLSMSMLSVANAAIDLDPIDAGSTTESTPYVFGENSVRVNFPKNTPETTDYFQFTIGSLQDISFSITPNDAAGVIAVHVFVDGVDFFGASIQGVGTTDVDLGPLATGQYVVSVRGKTSPPHSGFYTLTSPVPELSTLALMMSGFSLIGFMGYRRREI